MVGTVGLEPTAYRFPLTLAPKGTSSNTVSEPIAVNLWSLSSYLSRAQQEPC